MFCYQSYPRKRTLMAMTDIVSKWECGSMYILGFAKFYFRKSDV